MWKTQERKEQCFCIRVVCIYKSFTLYYNIPGAHADEPDENGNIFDIAILKLDQYFKPKQSKLYERYLFRKIKQEPEEKLDKFIVTLEIQGNKCKFLNLDEHLMDQVVEKCNSAELRKRILSLGDNVTLVTILAEANALESINREINEFIKQCRSNINKQSSSVKRQNPFGYNKGTKKREHFHYVEQETSESLSISEQDSVLFKQKSKLV